MRRACLTALVAALLRCSEADTPTRLPISPADAGDGAAPIIPEVPSPPESDAPDGAVAPPIVLPGPSRGSAIAVTRDDELVAMVNTDSGSVSVFGTDATTRLSETPVGGEPAALVVAPDDRTLFVTSKADGTVMRIAALDSKAPEASAAVAVGSEPVGLALSPTGARLFVASSADGTVAVLDTASLDRLYDVTMPRGLPWSVAVTNDLDADDDDESVWVTRFGSVRAGGTPQAEGADNGRHGLVYRFDTTSTNAVDMIPLAPLPDVGFSDATGIATGCFPNQLGSLAIDEGRVYVPSTCASPRGPLRFDLQVHTVVSVIDAGGLSEVPTEAVNLSARVADLAPAAKMFASGPVDIAFVPGTREAWIVASGSDRVYPLSEEARGILVGETPIGLAASRDGSRLYVANRTSRDMTVVDLDSKAVVATLLATSKPAAGTDEEAVRRGRRFFHTALGRWSTEASVSCASCHPDGRSDGVTWHFMAGPRQSPSLDGTFAKGDAKDQRLLGWTANFDEVHDFEAIVRTVQGGAGAITDSNDFALPLEAVPVGGGVLNVAGLSGSAQAVVTALAKVKDWNEIERYLRSLRPPNAPSNLDSKLVEAGRQRFKEGGCALCHGGPKWTVSRRYYTPSVATLALLKATPLSTSKLPKDWNTDTLQIASEVVGGLVIPPPRVTCVLRRVGTYGSGATEVQADMKTVAQGQGGYNPPSLLGLVYSAPYLHGGAAETLEELFTEAFESHHQAAAGTFLAGVDSLALAKQRKLELIAFLRSIDATTEPFPIPPSAVICPNNVP